MNIIKFSESSLVYFVGHTKKKKVFDIIKILENNSNFYKNKFSKEIAGYNYLKNFGI